MHACNLSLLTTVDWLFLVLFESLLVLIPVFDRDDVFSRRRFQTVLKNKHLYIYMFSLLIVFIVYCLVILTIYPLIPSLQLLPPEEYK